MPYRDRTFSGAVSFTMFHHIPSPALQNRLFAEVYRVLRPGGVFAGTDSMRSLLMEIPKVPKLQTACTTFITEGMAVTTQSETVKQARKATLEFVLQNHPLDCPVCDAGGQCELQDATPSSRPGESKQLEATAARLCGSWDQPDRKARHARRIVSALTPGSREVSVFVKRCECKDRIWNRGWGPLIRTPCWMRSAAWFQATARPTLIVRVRKGQRSPINLHLAMPLARVS